MPVKKTAAEECCAKCEKDIAALRKEVAALKKELAKKSAGGTDLRVSDLITFLGVWCGSGPWTDEQKKAMNEARKRLF
jgi:hypothetical protein